VVGIGRAVHAHVDAIAAGRGRVLVILADEERITVTMFRDELGTSRVTRRHR
jgi:hypothetical protein